MKKEAIGNYNAVRGGERPTSLNALAEARKLAPLPEVRRKILRRLTLRLDEEGLCEFHRGQKSSLQ
jgi:hypothetical protein